MSDIPKETKEEFIERYPRPRSKSRVLVRCYCSGECCTGWAWGYANDLSNYEELAE